MTATYEFLVDWDGLDGLLLGSFEHGLDGWVPGGTVPPAIEQSDTRAFHGGNSLKITWGTGGLFPQIQLNKSGFVIGREYTLHAWVYVPTGEPHMKVAVGTVGVGSASTANDEWTEITFTFTATAAIHSLQVWADTAPTAGDEGWVDWIHCVGTGGDVTRRTLRRSPVSLQYGRDQVRALSPMAPGRMTGVELNNLSKDYSPENSASPLFGYLNPARPVRISAYTDTAVHTLFTGRLDAFDALPNRLERSVATSGLDALAGLHDQSVTTELYPSVQTGQAVHLILDAIGWPLEARDIDPGATTIRFWVEEDTDAFSALTRVVESEGPTAAAYIAPDDSFVFRDRHHRLIRTASTTPQATFRSTGAEPKFSEPLIYDVGWRDIVNSFGFQVEERELSGDLSVVWESEQVYTISNGETLPLTVTSEEPFTGAQTPTQDVDYMLTGGAVSITLSRTSGRSTTIFVKSTGGTDAIIQGLALRAQLVTVARTIQINLEDPTSVQLHGRSGLPSGMSAPWAGVHDALAIGEMILGQYAQRRPIVTFRIISGQGTDSARLTQQLERDLADRVTVIDAETGIDDDFFIEQIQHTISEVGRVHETFFGCEKAPAAITDVFILDSATMGVLDTDRLGGVGLDDSDTVFILDDGLLDTEVLAH